MQFVKHFTGSWGAWPAYSGSAISGKRCEKIRNYARMRRAFSTSKRHRRSRGFGWSVVTYQSPNQLGLVTLSGIVVDPRPFRDWRGEPKARGGRGGGGRGGGNRFTGSSRGGGGKGGKPPPHPGGGDHPGKQA